MSIIEAQPSCGAATGVPVGGSGLVNSFGDNYIKDNSTTNISGSLTSTSTD